MQQRTSTNRSALLDGRRSTRVSGTTLPDAVLYGPVQIVPTANAHDRTVELFCRRSPPPPWNSLFPPSPTRGGVRNFESRILSLPPPLLGGLGHCLGRRIRLHPPT